MRPLLVLCVDGESATLGGRRLVLSIAGYEVVTANCAKDALQLLRESAIDIVVVDQLLPDMPGTRLSHKIKQLKPDVPVVLLTRSPDLPPAGSSGIDLLISHDSYPTEFLSALTRVIAERCALPLADAATATTKLSEAM